MTTFTKEFDVIIIGGGPAGLSAAQWCSDLGMKSVVVEKNKELGGQLLWTFNAIKNYLGLEVANGRELRDLFVETLKNSDFDQMLNRTVVHADLRRRIIDLSDGTRLTAKAIIIATGVRRKILDIPGELEFRGRGVLESGAKDTEQVRGKTVAIVGGGDAALENALILSETAEKILIIHRGNRFSARNEFIKRVYQRSNISIAFDAAVTVIIGRESVAGVEIRVVGKPALRQIPVDHVLIRIGVKPNTEQFREILECNDSGYIVINNSYSTDVDRIYAIGDVTNAGPQTIAGAIGQGSAVAKVISRIFGPKEERLITS